MDDNFNADKTKAKDNNLALAENHYLHPNLLIFEVFLTNSFGLLIKNKKSFKFKRVDYTYKMSFNTTTITKKN